MDRFFPATGQVATNFISLHLCYLWETRVLVVVVQQSPSGSFETERTGCILFQGSDTWRKARRHHQHTALGTASRPGTPRQSSTTRNGLYGYLRSAKLTVAIDNLPDHHKTKSNRRRHGRRPFTP